MPYMTTKQLAEYVERRDREAEEFRQRLIKEVAEGATVYRNHYACSTSSTCEYEWESVWTAKCDDSCPECGIKNNSPRSSEDITHEFREGGKYFLPGHNVT